MRLKIIVALGISMSFGLANASNIEKSTVVENTILNEAANSQKVVDKSSDSAFELEAEIESLQAEISNLEVYQGHLKQLNMSQNQEMASLDVQLNDIADTRQSVVPLMYEMLNGLAKYVEQDMPIRLDTRINRIEKLRVLMVQANISDAEKFRRILEAYQIELDYVNKLGTYTSTIDIGGKRREVEQLYLGHISFIARSVDKQHYWSWSQSSKSWIALDDEYMSDLNQAYLVANKHTSPSILRLPLVTTEVN